MRSSKKRNDIDKFHSKATKRNISKDISKAKERKETSQKKFQKQRNEKKHLKGNLKSNLQNISKAKQRKLVPRNTTKTKQRKKYIYVQAGEDSNAAKYGRHGN